MRVTFRGRVGHRKGGEVVTIIEVLYKTFVPVNWLVAFLLVIVVLPV